MLNKTSTLSAQAPLKDSIGDGGRVILEDRQIQSRVYVLKYLAPESGKTSPEEGEIIIPNYSTQSASERLVRLDNSFSAANLRVILRERPAKAEHTASTHGAKGTVGYDSFIEIITGSKLSMDSRPFPTMNAQEVV